MAEVHDTVLDRVVAMKRVTAGGWAISEARARFLREARLAAQLDHPGIAALYDAGVDERGPYVTMRLVRGPDLGRVLREGHLSQPRALAIFADVASALAAVHANGIVHRDLKPANILLEQPNTHEERAVLTDFGIATLADDRHVPLTAEGRVIGTPGYIAPEVMDGGRATSAADQWVLGVALGAHAYWSGTEHRQKPAARAASQSRRD